MFIQTLSDSTLEISSVQPMILDFCSTWAACLPPLNCRYHVDTHMVYTDESFVEVPTSSGTLWRSLSSFCLLFNNVFMARLCTLYLTVHSTSTLAMWHPLYRLPLPCRVSVSTEILRQVSHLHKRMRVTCLLLVTWLYNSAQQWGHRSSCFACNLNSECALDSDVCLFFILVRQVDHYTMQYVVSSETIHTCVAFLLNFHQSAESHARTPPKPVTLL